MMHRPAAIATLATLLATAWLATPGLGADVTDANDATEAAEPAAICQARSMAKTETVTSEIGSGSSSSSSSSSTSSSSTSSTTTPALQNCAQPLSTGQGPVATDCLFILQVATALQTCPSPCVCAPKGALPTSATDALLCLQRSAGLNVTLSCPCP